MTQTEIDKIAREYAEEKANEYYYDRDYDNRRKIKVSSIVNQVAPIIRWLSNRYYLVEKDKLKSKYAELEDEWIEKSLKEIHPDAYVAQTQLKLLKFLFPDIAKEVEE